MGNFLRVVFVESRVVRVSSSVLDGCWAIDDEADQVARAGAVLSDAANWQVWRVESKKCKSETGDARTRSENDAPSLVDHKGLATYRQHKVL